MPIQRQYDKNLPDSGLNQLLKKSRRMIETTISEFADLMNIERTRARTLAGLITSLVAKITAFNMANYFNLLLGEPLLHIKEFTC